MTRALLVLACVFALPVTASSLDREAVRKVMKTASPGLKRCYEQALKSDGPATGGQARLTLTVSAEGRVTNVKVDSPQMSAAFATCLEHVASKLVFLSGPAPWSIVWPVVFKPSEP